MTDSSSILRLAEEYASAKGYRFGHGAEGYMRDHAAQAEAEIAQLSVGERDTKLKEAERNFAKLIDGMIEAAHNIDGYEAGHPGAIGEDTLAQALGNLCPLWPFC